MSTTEKTAEKVSEYLIWLDLEMTGLDVHKESIIEIGTVITDNELNIVAEGPNLVIHQADSLLATMDEWNQQHHGESGLIDAVKNSTLSMEMAESQTIDFLKKYLKPGESPLCGNSVHMDRRFMHRYMPTLEAFFHYRNLDVSTIKELAKRWAPESYKKLDKESKHRAVDDIYESIEELRYYRSFFFVSNPDRKIDKE